MPISCFHRIAFTHWWGGAWKGDQAQIIGSIVNFLNAVLIISGSRQTIGAAIIPAAAPSEPEAEIGSGVHRFGLGLLCAPATPPCCALQIDLGSLSVSAEGKSVKFFLIR
jgi:hypothetical protein